MRAVIFGLIPTWELMRNHPMRNCHPTKLPPTYFRDDTCHQDSPAESLQNNPQGTRDCLPKDIRLQLKPLFDALFHHLCPFSALSLSYVFRRLSNGCLFEAICNFTFRMNSFPFLKTLRAAIRPSRDFLSRASMMSLRALIRPFWDSPMP